MAIRMHLSTLRWGSGFSFEEGAFLNLIYADLSQLKQKHTEHTRTTDKDTGWTSTSYSISVDSSKVKFEVATTCMCWRCISGGRNEHSKASSSEHLEESDKDLKVLEAKINKAVVSSVQNLLSFQYYNLREMHEKSSGNDDAYVISEDWTSKFKKISTELVDDMAKELEGPVLNAALDDPLFQVHEVMTGDGGTVTLCITRGDRKPIYVENVLMQDAQAMFEVEDGLHTSHIGARLKEALDNALQRARCAVKGSLIIINVWDIGKQTSKEPNVHGVFKSDLWS
jgi:hypothetical protein